MYNSLLIVEGVTWGETWALVGICFGIVLLIMAFFVLVMTMFGVISKKKKATPAAEPAKPVAKPVATGEIDEADYAAIATALHLYFGGEHDKESNVITIKNVSQEYSPWLN